MAKRWNFERACRAAAIDSGVNFLPSQTGNASGWHASLEIDRLDRPAFSRAGYRVRTDVLSTSRGLGADLAYTAGTVRLQTAKSFGSHTIAAEAKVGVAFGSNAPIFDSYRLGGPLRLSGYRVDQFTGRDGAYGRLQYYNQIMRLPSILGSGVYVGGSIEAGRVNTLILTGGDSGALWSGSLFLGADTFIGPAYLGIARTSTSRNAVYLLFGYP